MVKKELVEGMHHALAKGQTLKQAMMSFYNAGYPKAEIEEAAKYLQSAMSNQQQPAQPIQQKRILEKPVKKKWFSKNKTVEQKPVQQLFPQPKPQQIQQLQVKTPTQKVLSTDQQPEKKARRLFYIIMISLLVILVGALVAIIFFREQLVNFFTNKLG